MDEMVSQAGEGLLGISTAREDGVAGTEAKGAVVESSATAADVG